MRVPYLLYSFSAAVSSLLLSGALSPARAQVSLGAGSANGPIRIFNSDLAIFEAGDVRKDISCTVTDSKPVLGFDLRYHAGYEVSIPLKELAGGENLLTILFRVTAEGQDREPVYFFQKIRVPSLGDDLKGEAYLQGTFELGEGSYHVEWLMRDRAERICSSSWDMEASLGPKDKQIALALSPGSVQASDREQFQEEPPVLRAEDQPPLKVRVLVNFAPQNSHSASLQPMDTTALVQILRSISRDPRIGKFSVVAFNLQEQKVVYRAENAEHIDFPALGQALTAISPGTVSLKNLSDKHGDTKFLADFLRSEVGTPGDRPDAVVIAGPKAMLEENVPADSLKDLGEVRYPVFYMNYNLYPQQIPWNDSIGKAVKFLKGYEYTISKPRDLWFAVTEMVSRIVKAKLNRPVLGASSE